MDNLEPTLKDNIKLYQQNNRLVKKCQETLTKVIEKYSEEQEPPEECIPTDQVLTIMSQVSKVSVELARSTLELVKVQEILDKSSVEPDSGSTSSLLTK